MYVYFLKFLFILILLILFYWYDINLFSRYYYANVDEIRMIRKEKWNNNDFPKMKKELLKILNVHYSNKPDNETLLEELL